MTRLRLALLAVPALLAPLLPLAATPAAAACTTGYRVLSGTVLGSDARRVNALVGFDFTDARGNHLGATYGAANFGCPGVRGYGVYLRLNPTLPATGGATGTVSWSLRAPANATAVYIESYPKNTSHLTDESRYGHALRRFGVPAAASVTIRLPLICAQGGTTGGIWGYGYRNGVRARLDRIAAWSMAPDNNVANPILGFTVGAVATNGFYNLANLPPNQRYVVLAWQNGVQKTIPNVPVYPCRQTPLNIGF